MAIALVTGASKGWGGPWREELADAGLDPRARRPPRVTRWPRPSGPSSPTWPATPSLVAIAGDVADPRHRAGPGARRAGAGRARPPRQQRQHARRHPPARRWRRYPLDELRRRCEVNVVAPLALVQEAMASVAPLDAPGRGEHHVGRVGRGLRGVGGLRAVQGGARPHERGPGRRGARRSSCGPSIPETCGRRCTRTPSRVRTSPTARCPSEVVPDLVAPRRGAPAQRAVPPVGPARRRDDAAEGRARHDHAHPHRRPSRRHPRHHDRPGPEPGAHRAPHLRAPTRARGEHAARGTGHDEGRGQDARRAPERRQPRALALLGAAPLSRRRRPRRRQHVGDPRRRGAGRRRGPGARSRCTSRRACPPTCGRWSCAGGTSRGSEPSPVT